MASVGYSAWRLHRVHEMNCVDSKDIVVFPRQKHTSWALSHTAAPSAAAAVI
jgi:hypothetical protein